MVCRHLHYPSTRTPGRTRGIDTQSWLLLLLCWCYCCVFLLVTACYNYNPQTPDGKFNFTCPEAVPALAVSYNDRLSLGWNKDKAAAPYDQGIVFLDEPRDPPYAKYNYIENVQTDSPSNNWQAASYSALGSTTAGAETCGCRACPDKVTCNLANAGPSTGALVPETGNFAGNMAYNPGLSACQGFQGSCLGLNGDECCVGTGSYEYRSGAGGACTENCKNYWSGISKDMPLSELWKEFQVDLPVFDFSA